nr:MAG TPA: hypothetical protein [Caudoviricetes sp.]
MPRRHPYDGALLFAHILPTFPRKNSVKHGKTRINRKAAQPYSHKGKRLNS